MRKFAMLFAVVLVASGSAVLALPPDQAHSQLTCDYTGPISVYLGRNNQASTLAEDARGVNGIHIEPHIFIDVRGADNQPAWPSTYSVKMRSVTVSGNAFGCGWDDGVIMDQPHWFHGRGHAENLEIYADVYGPLYTPFLFTMGPLTNIKVNCPDVDADYQVALGDVTTFVALYNSGQYHYAIDFDFDGSLDQTDISMFLAAYNASLTTHCY